MSQARRLEGLGDLRAEDQADLPPVLGGEPLVVDRRDVEHCLHQALFGAALEVAEFPDRLVDGVVPQEAAHAFAAVEGAGACPPLPALVLDPDRFFTINDGGVIDDTDPLFQGSPPSWLMFGPSLDRGHDNIKISTKSIHLACG